MNEMWVFLHGTPLTPAVWRSLAERLRGASASVWCPSLNAPGDSVSHAARIAAELPAGSRVKVVGHSFGGQVAIDLALLLARDDRLAGLGVLCSRATPFPAFGQTARAIRDGRMPDAQAAIERWFTPWERRHGSPLIDYARNCMNEAPPGVWADALDSIAHYDRVADLARIQVPSVVIAAEFDAVSPPAAMRQLAGRLTHARFRVLRGTSHMGPFLRPDALATLVRDGLRRHTTGA